MGAHRQFRLWGKTQNIKLDKYTASKETKFMGQGPRKEHRHAICSLQRGPLIHRQCP